MRNVLVPDWLKRSDFQISTSHANRLNRESEYRNLTHYTSMLFLMTYQSASRNPIVRSLLLKRGAPISQVPSAQCPVPVWARTWARRRATARASSPSSATASDGTARRSSRARVRYEPVVPGRAPLRFFSCSKIGQPTTDAPRPRSPLDSPSIPPVSFIAVHTEYRGGQRR